MQDICSTLEPLLNRYADEEGFTFNAIHGFYTAMAIIPFNLKTDERNEILFGTLVTLSREDSVLLEQALDQLSRAIDRQFNEEEGFELSCEEFADPDDENLMDWCCGFIQAHIMSEEKWFQENEQEVSELLLPLMLGSGLFDDEPEFEAILENEKLTEDMCSQIPEVLMELYLLFNSPEEASGKSSVKPSKPARKDSPHKRH
ncbi:MULTISPECIES: YecA family protein [unclassified Endozoicomonas]|uniref:YecA/YgfB family protein n=1 Tax=unclassified Endozoicomonas TaxID=2644528 RepID=UPI0021483DBA|nr:MULTISPECIES: YecA family protein [unclassified Endozoicomonas]